MAFSGDETIGGNGGLKKWHPEISPLEEANRPFSRAISLDRRSVKWHA